MSPRALLLLLFLLAPGALAQTPRAALVTPSFTITVMAEKCASKELRGGLAAMGIDEEHVGLSREVEVSDGAGKHRACAAFHAEPMPHIDVIGEDGRSGSFPLDAFEEVGKRAF